VSVAPSPEGALLLHGQPGSGHGQPGSVHGQPGSGRDWNRVLALLDPSMGALSLDSCLRCDHAPTSRC
jgi:hypothetical protein